MAVSIVQIAVFSQNFAAGTPGTHNYTATFASPVTAGNTIVVAAGGQTNAIAGGAGTAGSSMSDNNGNTYTQGCWTDGGFLSGGYGGLFFAPTVNAGSTTVQLALDTIQLFGWQLSWDVMIIAVEYSGFGTASLQDGFAANIFGSGGNAPVDVTVTDSTSTSVTVEFTGPSGTGGPGTNAICAVLDLKSTLSSVLDLFVGISRTFSSSGMGCSITSPSGYNAMTLEQTETTPAVDDYLYFWDGAHLATVRLQPQVFVVT